MNTILRSASERVEQHDFMVSIFELEILPVDVKISLTVRDEK
jgi:hypothetical protein